MHIMKKCQAMKQWVEDEKLNCLPQKQLFATAFWNVLANMSQSAGAAIAKQHRWSALNNYICFSQFWSLVSTRSRHWQIHCLVRALFLVCTWSSFGCPPTWWREMGMGDENLSLSLFIRALVPFMMPVSSFSGHLPRPQLLIPAHWGLRFQHEFWRDTFSLQQSMSSTLYLTQCCSFVLCFSCNIP